MAKAKENISTRRADAAHTSMLPKPAKAQKPKCTAEQRFKMIQEAAYLRAEKAGFTGDGMKYWLAAEKDIDGRLSKG